LGAAFPPDVPWQREFEGAFLYEETPDQMRAILQTKADMEVPKPMGSADFGDVGYGKTEVAIRAAFKAVMEAARSPVLVPTTVLASNISTPSVSEWPIPGANRAVIPLPHCGPAEAGRATIVRRGGGHCHWNGIGSCSRHRFQKISDWS